MLWDLLSKYISLNIVPVIVQMAKYAGHEVLYTPPHYSDLQTIELVWAIVKGEVGMQYTTNATFGLVLTRLNKAFGNLCADTVAGCIRKTNKNLENLFLQIGGDFILKMIIWWIYLMIQIQLIKTQVNLILTLRIVFFYDTE